MIIELIATIIAIDAICQLQIESVSPFENTVVESVALPMVAERAITPPVIQLSGKKSGTHYKYISKRHTAMAILHTGHKRVIYWKRIRSRTWKKKITSQLEVLTIILIVMSVI